MNKKQLLLTTLFEIGLIGPGTWLAFVIMMAAAGKGPPGFHNFIFGLELYFYGYLPLIIFCIPLAWVNLNNPARSKKFISIPLYYASLIIPLVIALSYIMSPLLCLGLSAAYLYLVYFFISAWRKKRALARNSGVSLDRI